MPPFQALVASAVVVLLLAPAQLFSAGFQLSYTVVTGILVWGIPLYQALREKWHAGIVQKYQYLGTVTKLSTKLFEALAGTLCVSLSATLASAPLSILYFGVLAPMAILLNMILIPLASLVIVSGLFSLLVGFLLQLTFVSSFFNHGPLLLITFTHTILNWTVTLPAAFYPMAWVTKSLGFLTVFLFLGSLLTTRSLKLGKPALFGFPVVITVGMIFLNLLLNH
jgi:competence protein ComEC